MRKLAIVATVLFAVGCKGGSVAGNYSLDKGAMEKAMDEKIAKLPADQQGMAKFGKELIKMMDMKLKLTEDGKGEMTTTMPSMKEGEKSQTKTDPVTWEKKENKITISDGKKPITCTLDGNKIVCSDEKEQMSMVFVKG